MKKTTCFCLLFALFFSVFSYAQTEEPEKSSFFKPSDTLNVKRKNGLLIAESALFLTSFVVLDKQWYNGNEKTSFHFTSKSNEFGLMDKIGHGFSSYKITRLTAKAFYWSGESEKKQLIYGAAFGLGATTGKEILDGFTKEWGWSWYNFGANFVGTGLYVGQELLWKEQRIQPKFSYNNSKSKGVVTNTMGSGYLDRVLKNYDGQTYWLSFNVNSFAKTDYIPNWLNFSVGYGVDGYLHNADATILPTRSKSLYLSLDVDLTKIKTKSHFVNTLLVLFNSVKIPAPTLEINSKKGTFGHYMYF
ncbi:YfiM family protein [Flavobacterium agricola]|uniref:YfiM family protein n=1 Tax=Flavobacterium agricola TaxID=2870839 RepID=A0ABY6M384_9FLAO|nr:YfiM family protein [Flavobacterium agricola]UYW01433.1 YfiM family protein [Flavobacterium agricola]